MSTITQIEGDPKTCKTTLALSRALVIPKVDNPKEQHYLQYFEMDVGGLGRARVRYEPLLADGRIRHRSYFLPQQAIREMILGKSRLKPAEKTVGMMELWYKMLMDYIDSLEDPLCDALVLDSWAQVWNLCSSGVLQEKQEYDIKHGKGNIRERLLQIEYSEPNSRMRAIAYASREADKDLILIAHLTDERKDQMVNGTWKEGVPTGQYIPVGWSHTDKEINVAIRMRTEMVPNDPDDYRSEKVLRPIGKIRLCGDTLDVVGAEFREPSWQIVDNYIRALRGG